jgi:MFS family permease
MLAYILSFVDRQVIALMIEPIKHDLALSDTQFSLLHGLAFSLFYAFMGAPLALLADRYSRSKLMAIGVVFWSIATMACGTSKNFLHMFLARIGVGVGEAALSPAFYSMASDMFPKERLGRAIGIYSLGAFIGGGIAFLIGGYIISLLKGVDYVVLPILGELRPWQLTFLIVGLPGLILAPIMLLTIRDPKRRNLKKTSNGETLQPTLRNTFAFIKSHKQTFFYHHIGFSFYTMTLYAMMGWAPAFYMRHFGLTPSQAGFYLGVILLLANTSGVYFCGYLTDWLTKRGHSDAAMKTGTIGALGLLIPAALFTQVDSMMFSLVLLTLAMFFGSFPFTTAIASTQVLAPNQLRAQVSAIFLLVVNLIGAGLSMTLVALVTDKIFKNPLLVGHSISIVAIITTTLGAILLHIGCRHFRQSMLKEKTA